MKKWLKKHGKWVAIGLGVLFSANAIFGITQSLGEGRELYLVMNFASALIWILLILIWSGIAGRVYKW